MAATGFAVIANNNGGYEPSEDFKWRKKEAEKFTNFLMNKSKAELVDIIIQAANDDPEMIYMLGFEDELEEV